MDKSNNILGFITAFPDKLWFSNDLACNKGMTMEIWGKIDQAMVDKEIFAMNFNVSLHDLHNHFGDQRHSFYYARNKNLTLREIIENIDTLDLMGVCMNPNITIQFLRNGFDNDWFSPNEMNWVSISRNPGIPLAGILSTIDDIRFHWDWSCICGNSGLDMIEVEKNLYNEKCDWHLWHLSSNSKFTVSLLYLLLDRDLSGQTIDISCERSIAHDIFHDQLHWYMISRNIDIDPQEFLETCHDKRFLWVPSGTSENSSFTWDFICKNFEHAELCDIQGLSKNINVTKTLMQEQGLEPNMYEYCSNPSISIQDIPHDIDPVDFMQLSCNPLDAHPDFGKAQMYRENMMH